MVQLLKCGSSLFGKTVHQKIKRRKKEDKAQCVITPQEQGNRKIQQKMVPSHYEIALGRLTHPLFAEALISTPFFPNSR